ncbi:unnamed protein product [Leptosia nina]|uniref:Uncharacterized protein n=1 Tax=Leptosia nina TaxID=320188 RepID=A0AAV1IVU2_9NEOP
MYKNCNLYYVTFIISVAGSTMIPNEYTQQYHLPNCENGGLLVESFFNTIFSEFQNNPPACVCVQMCSNQPTYCYPNGCFKTSVNNRKSVNPISKIDSKVQPIFLVDQDKDLFELLERRNSIDNSVKTERPLNEFTLRPNPFSELVFKQKRLPKLKMRYNLREQVKNTKPSKLKRDSVNLSKTRWPLNKQVFHSKQPRNEIKHYKRNDDTTQANFFTSMLQEQDETNYTPKYFKKYLTKRENGNVNVEALYLYKTDSANFSLENLIDNMIEGSLDGNTNNVKLNLSMRMNNSNDLLAEFTSKTLRNVHERDFNATEYNNDFRVVSLNSDDKTTDYHSNAKLTQMDDKNNASVTDMIEKMTSEIEKQNNISIKIVEQIIGSKLDLLPTHDAQISIEIFENILPHVGTKNLSEETNNVENNVLNKRGVPMAHIYVPLKGKSKQQERRQRKIKLY